MAGNIAEGDDQTAIRKSLPIVIVTTSFVGGLVPAGDGIAAICGGSLGRRDC